MCHLFYIFLSLTGIPCQRPQQPPFDQLPALITYYNPALGGINCDHDCTTVADGSIVTDASYGAWAACDASLLGVVVMLGGVGRVECRDTGGMVRPFWSDYWRAWVLPFDLLAKEKPINNYGLVAWRVVDGY